MQIIFAFDFARKRVGKIADFLFHTSLGNFQGIPNTETSIQFINVFKIQRPHP